MGMLLVPLELGGWYCCHWHCSVCRIAAESHALSAPPFPSSRHCALWQLQVASGGDSHEVLPMLLIVPTWFGGASGGMMLLGFGDVVLPGLLLVYARVFDLQHHRSLCSSYFVPASIGYGVGLMLTYGALYLQLGGDQVNMHAESVSRRWPDAFMHPMHHPLAQHC